MNRLAFQSAALTAILLVGASFLPGKIKEDLKRQPLVISAENYADGEYLLKVSVTDGIATVIGLAIVVDLDGKTVAVADPVPPEEPEEPDVPDAPDAPDVAELIVQVQKNMEAIGKAAEFDFQRRVLKNSLELSAGVHTTRASAYNHVMTQFTLWISPTQADYTKQWSPWLMYWTNQFEAEDDLEKFKKSVKAAIASLG